MPTRTLNNTQNASGTDRQAFGPQQDQATPTGSLPGSGSGGGTPTGPAGGDLSGTYPNPTIRAGLLMPWFNVVKYGAIGDNGVTDNTTAFNNAIAALIAAGGGVIYVPAAVGIYYVNTAALTPITVPCRILGDSPQCSRIYNMHASSTIFYLHTPYPCVVENLNLLSAGGAGSTGLYVDSNVGGTWNAGTIVRNVYSTGAEIGLQMANVGGWLIESCIVGATSYSIALNNTVNFDAGGGRVNKCTLVGTTAGIYTQVDGLSITDNEFQTSLYGLVWVCGGVDLWFIGNHCENLVNAAVFLQPPAGQTIQQVQIVGNEFNSEANNSMDCVDIQSGVGSVDQLTITGNTFQCGLNKVCVSLNNASCVVIIGNTFDNNSGTGINIPASCSNGYAGALTNRFKSGGVNIVNTAGFDT